MEIEIICHPLGDWQTNAYILISTSTNNCWVIDPGFNPSQLLLTIEKRKLKVQKFILTHAHLDHIAGLQDMRDAFPDVPIYIHEDEQEFLEDPVLNLSAAWSPQIVAPAADHLLKHGDTLEIDGIVFDIRHTPGHSPGGIVLYQKESHIAIVGDTLFREGIGRYDFPTSDGPTLMKSITEQLMTLPDEVEILPGHGPTSNIGHERSRNPFLNR